MPLIECIPGPAETPVAGNMYSFQKDDYGRYVARVERFEHMACLLATPHYRQVPDVPETQSVKAQREPVAPPPKMDPIAVPGEDPAKQAHGLLANSQPGDAGGTTLLASKKRGGRPSNKSIGA